MLVAIAFWLFLISSFSLLWFVGGFDGRVVAGGCLLATLLTFVANSVLGFAGARPVLLLIDSGLLLLAIWVALRSGFYWPLWFAAFQTISVACEVAYFLFSDPYTRLYGNLAAYWAIPALGAAVAGVLLDRRIKSGAGD